MLNKIQNSSQWNVSRVEVKGEIAQAKLLGGRGDHKKWLTESENKQFEYTVNENADSQKGFHSRL